jgi:SAM-dependent methyltransferase
VQGDAGQLAALWGEQFEAVTLVWTLHHVDDPEAILRQVHRVLKQGGRVLIGEWVVSEEEERGICFRLHSSETDHRSIPDMPGRAKQSPISNLGIASAEKHRLAMTVGVSALHEWPVRAMEQLAMTPVGLPQRSGVGASLAACDAP